MEKQFNQALARPWARAEFPMVAAWLKASERPLTTIVACTGRPKMYWPMVSPENGLMADSTFCGGMGELRSAAQAIKARAMFRAGSGNAADAFQDLFACHRLARLCAQKPLLVDGLVASVLDGIAWSGDIALVHHANLNKGQLGRFRADLESLPPMPQTGVANYFGEQPFCLEMVCGLARGEPLICKSLFESALSGSQAVKGLRKLAADPRLDWDQVLRAINTWYGKAVEADRNATYGRRHEALKAIESEISATARNVENAKRLAQLLSPKGSADELSRQTAAALFNQSGGCFWDVAGVDPKEQARERLRDLAIALALYHNDHGKYPGNLAELVPKYIARLPKDPFSEEDFRYELHGIGYRLSSSVVADGIPPISIRTPDQVQ